MIRLTSTDLISLITAQNGARAVVSYSDATGSAYTGGTQPTSITSATTTTICSSPAASIVRDIDFINIKNTFAGSHTITVQLNVSATLYVLVTMALLTDESLSYTHGSGWCAIDANGNRKEVTSSTFSSITNTGLTAGRVVFAGTGGLLSDDSGFTFNTSGDILTVGALVSTNSVTAGTTGSTHVFTGTAGGNIFSVKAASGGDAFLLFALAAGSGGGLSALNNALSDFEPMAITGETVTLKYRTGAGTSADGITVAAAGAVAFPQYTAATFVAGDKYLVVDASGNIHRSAVGPAS